jgi:hypothetical protein
MKWRLAVAKNTPLPWKLHDRHGGDLITDEAGKCGVARMIVRIHSIEEMHPAEMRANGDLVVRAVNAHADLLAACEAVLQRINTGENPAAGCVAAPTAEIACRQMLESAIAKAKGGAS